MSIFRYDTIFLGGKIMIKKTCIYLVLLIMVISLPLVAKPDINFSGLFQTWFSYAPQLDRDDDGYGFSLRRLRLAPSGSFSEKIKWGFQVAWDMQKASLLDVYLDFQLSPYFKIKIGQFPAPGAISGALTSSGKLDLVDRSQVTESWNGHSNLSSYRALGVQLYGALIEKKLNYALMVANASTSSLFTPRISSPAYSNDLNGISFWGRLEAFPVDGIQVGAFIQFGDMKTYSEKKEYTSQSYGANFFYIKNNINFKAEYLAGEYGQKDHETKYNGICLVLGYTVNKVEPIIRYDTYTPNDGEPALLGIERYSNITLGINYFYSSTIKFQANYVIRNETMSEGLEKLDNNIFYLCFQYSFK